MGYCSVVSKNEIKYIGLNTVAGKHSCKDENLDTYSKMKRFFFFLFVSSWYLISFWKRLTGSLRCKLMYIIIFV